jgi:ribonucleoside-diphosphate reductase alpha chain
MSRERLPNRRPSERFEFKHASIDYNCTLSRFEDGRLAELFLSATKAGSRSDALAQDSAIVFSLAVQFGADPKAIRHALGREVDGAAASPLGAALDLLAERGAL